jgi:hypothetical protein
LQAATFLAAAIAFFVFDVTGDTRATLLPSTFVSTDFNAFPAGILGEVAAVLFRTAFFELGSRDDGIAVPLAVGFVLLLDSRDDSCLTNDRLPDLSIALSPGLHTSYAHVPR